MDKEWRSVEYDPPPDNKVVQVNSNDGTTLKKQGNLWWLPDGSMYVYFTPEWWREI